MICKFNSIKEKITSGQLLRGLWCSLASENAVEVISTIGYDWLLLDMEHSPNELNSIIGQLRILDGSDTHGFVRPPDDDKIMIKRLLDAGVKNLLFPQVQNLSQAQEIVRATRFPPEGIRGVSTAGRAAWYGAKKNYLLSAKEELIIAIQIETTVALEAVEEIAKCPGIDIIFFGPADLSADMGFLGQLSHSLVVEAISNNIRKVVLNGKMAGVLAPDLMVAKRYYDAGARFLAIGSDIQSMRSKAEEILSDARFE